MREKRRIRGDTKNRNLAKESKKYLQVRIECVIKYIGAHNPIFSALENTKTNAIKPIESIRTFLFKDFINLINT
ncbi:MAG: hypothetical protein KAR00_02725 [Candidatus Pacebacteria bacterium]|nr:hypothetical protein [Candidatus Paceibacterota bacterium]